MTKIKRNDVLTYLEEESKTVDQKTKNSIEQTIAYLQSKEQEFEAQWGKFIEFTSKEVEKFNEKVKDLKVLIDSDIQKHRNQKPSVCLRIQSQNPEIHYRNGFCDISNHDNEYVFFNGRTTEKDMTDFEKLKKALIEELNSKELLELCKTIKEVVIDRKR